VNGRDCGLELVWAGPPQAQRALQQPVALVDPGRVPQRAILLLEQHELAAGPGARLAAGVVQEHQGGEAQRLGLIGHQHGEQLREPDRLVAQLAADERVALGGRVALVEDEVQHGEDRADPLGQEMIGRHAEGDAGVPDLGLGAHEALGHRRLWDEERAGDRSGGESAQRTQRQRDTGLGRQRRVAAREDEREPLVRDRAQVVLLLGRGDALQLLQ
jgi:hypothetical protein